MNIEIYIGCILFFILTPGIVFTVSKNKYISAFIHSIIFSIFYNLFPKNLESFDQDVIVYLDASCNTLLDDSNPPPEDTPMYLIQKDKCINMSDYED